MNIEKITYKMVKDTINNGEFNDFILKMMLSYLTDEQRGTILDELVNEQRSIEIEKGMEVWFNPKDNNYDLKDLIQEDMMKDAKLMSPGGCITGKIIKDCNYRDECSPYASEYIIHACLRIKDDGDTEYKEVRVRRSNIRTLWKPLE